MVIGHLNAISPITGERQMFHPSSKKSKRTKQKVTGCGQPCFGPEESHGTSVLEWYLWAHKGECEWKQSAWIYQG